MIRLLIGVGVGVVIGYSVSRYIEARAAGVPLALAFRPDPGNLLTSVAVLQANLLRVTESFDPDAVIEPTMLNAGEDDDERISEPY